MGSSTSTQSPEILRRQLFAENIAALRDRQGSAVVNRIGVKCHTTAGDGGHGDFRWVSGAAAATYVDNNGTVIVPSGGNGSAAWLRDYKGAVNAAWFGWAAGNYNTAIQSALNTGSSEVDIPECVAEISSTLIVPASIKSITGVPFKTILYSQTAPGDFLISLSSCAISIYGLVLYGAHISGIGGIESVPSNRSGINANVSGDRGKFENVVIYGFDTGMYLGKPDASSFMHLFDHCDFNECNTGLRVIDGVNQTTLLNCVFRGNKVYSLRIEPTLVGVECVAIGVYNCTFEYSNGSDASFVAKNVRGMDVSACYFEGCKTTALYVYGDPTNGSQAITIHDCYFFMGAVADQRGDGVKIGSEVSAFTLNNNHFEGYTAAGFYPVKMIGYSANSGVVRDNFFNQCTGNPEKIITDIPYNLVSKATVNNHVLVRASGVTDGAGAMSSLPIGKIIAANAAGKIFLRIRISRHSDDVVTVFAEETVFLRAIVTGGTTIGIGYRPNPAGGGVTLAVGSTSTFNGALYADLTASVSSGDASTHYSFVVELLNGLDGGFVGDKLMQGSYS